MTRTIPILRLESPLVASTNGCFQISVPSRSMESRCVRRMSSDEGSAPMVYYSEFFGCEARQRAKEIWDEGKTEIERKNGVEMVRNRDLMQCVTVCCAGSSWHASEGE